MEDDQTAPENDSKTSRLPQSWRGLRRAFVLLVWVLSLLFFAQNAIASRMENEPRAALLYWMIVVVLILAGGIISLDQRSRLE